MIQETRSQKSGPTGGEGADLQLVRKSTANSRKRAVLTAGKNSYFIVRDESGQNVIEVSDKVAVVPITTQRQVPTTQWLRKSRRP